jgi:hypothetical protein
MRDCVIYHLYQKGSKTLIEYIKNNTEETISGVEHAAYNMRKANITSALTEGCSTQVQLLHT